MQYELPTAEELRDEDFALKYLAKILVEAFLDEQAQKNPGAYCPRSHHAIEDLVMEYREKKMRGE